MERERIFVTYSIASAVGANGPILGHHAILNYIDKHGDHYVIEGEPAVDNLRTTAKKAGAFLNEELFSSGVRNRDSQFGRLVATEREGKPKDRERPFENIYEAEDLSREWNTIRATTQMVNERGYEYRPRSQNSNTFAFVALRSAGLNASGTGYDPATRKSKYHLLPGRDYALSNPINAEASEGLIEKPEYEDETIAADRIRNLKGLMSDSYSEYWKGPKAESLQAEYRELLRAQGRLRAHPQDESVPPGAMVP